MGTHLARLGVNLTKESSAIAAGCRDRRIMFLHVLPNCFGPILVQASTAIGVAVIAEASLSVLGLARNRPIHRGARAWAMGARFSDARGGTVYLPVFFW